MCRGQRLTGVQARERVLAIIGWLCEQGALDSRAEADALLSAAGLAPLRESIELDARALQRLSPPASAPRRAPGERAVIACEFPLIGRDNELAKLLHAWRTLSKSGARFVCIAGEAGIGKTRLAEELLIAAQQESCAIARARTYSFETPLPYQPVSDWLRSPDVYDRVRAQPAALRTELARLVPELLAEDASLAPPGPLSDGWRRRQFLDALLQPFTLDAPPALLVLDDLQWCDGETIEYLQLLMRSAKQRPLLIVGTLRPAELDASHRVQGMLHQLLRDDPLIQIVLGALDKDACAKLSGLAAKRSLDEAAAVRLFRDSAGNPLFVIEGARDARDTRELAGGAYRETPTALPPKVHALIAQRLRGLSAQALNIIEVAAVIGRAFSTELLASAAGQDVDELLSLNRRCARGQACSKRQSACDCGFDFHFPLH
jgi:predicted ATPase